jgi:hypothetical protein
MQVLVVGGTGTLGRQIARRALDAGHQVRCMVRSPRKAAFLQEWGCELTRGDLLEPESLAYALEGQDAVIDAATARATDSASAYDIDWSGKQNLFAACPAAAVKRFVFVSLLEAGGPTFVVNQVVLPGKEAEAARCKKLVEAAGLRWFPQLYKTKRGVADYPDPAALAALIGNNPSPKEANLSPSYFGRRCEAGRRYAVVDKDGALWSCRSAKRHNDGYLGNIFEGSARMWTQIRRCPFDRCPCTVPANRGMIEGIG